MLCIVLSLSAFSLIGSATVTEKSKSYPTIMVAGYSSSSLFLKTDEGLESVWSVDLDKVLAEVLSRFAELGQSLGEAAFNHPEKFVKIGNELKDEFLKYMSMNPDGTSEYDIVSYTRDAAKAQYSYIKDNYGGIYNNETEICDDIAKWYGENGEDMIYSFHTDFRKSIVDCAKDLDELVENVLEYTGAEKVNIFAVSHGGETTSVYLSEYGRKNRVNNVVLTVPAIGGAALACDVMSRNIVFDEEEFMRFIENGMMFETDIQWLMKAQRLGFLDVLFNAIVEDIVLDVIGYWGSMWDFIPAQYYEGLKQEMLDETESAPIIAKSDYYHYELLPNMHEALSQCIENGANIYIVAGCDNASVTGLQENSDAIITVNSSTGAAVAPFGTRFADGYSCVGTTCSDKTHNHLSPAMNIDVSAGYLPEQTFLVSGLFHGMTWKDDYTISLCEKLLFSDELLDVRTDARYPQFRYSTNVCYGVTAAFDNSAEGYVSADDKYLVVRNISGKYTLRVTDVAVYGADMKITVPPATYLKPGESVSIPVKGTLPETELTVCNVVVSAKLIGSATPYITRQLTFTIMNGDAAENGSEYVSSEPQTPFDSFFSASVKVILTKLGVIFFVKMVFNFYNSVFGRLSLSSVC